jgi:hypothetical protein
VATIVAKTYKYKSQNISLKEQNFATKQKNTKSRTDN